MQHPDEGTIHTWLDGELAPDESAALEAHIASCPECSAAVAEARGLIAASSRILTKLDDVPAGVIPDRRVEAPGSQRRDAVLAPGRPARRRAWWTRSGLAAAAVVFVAAGTWVVARRVTPDETRVLGNAQETSAQVADSVADGTRVAPENSAPSSSPDTTSFAKAAAPYASRVAPPAARSQSGAAGRVAAASESRAPRMIIDSVRDLARRSENDQNRATAERFAPLPPAAPAPAPVITSPLAESAATQRAAAKREQRESKPAANVVTTGAAADVSGKDARLQKSALAGGLTELQQTVTLAGCYALTVDAASSGGAALQSSMRPSRIVLDTATAAVESDPAYRVARDLAPSEARPGSSMSWRPTGPQSFELIVGSGASASRFSIVVAPPGEPTRTDELRVPAPAPTGGTVPMRATRVVCPRQ